MQIASKLRGDKDMGFGSGMDTNDVTAVEVESYCHGLDAVTTSI